MAAHFWQRIFLQKCDNIYQTKTLIHCKICHCYILGLLLTVCYGNKLLLSLSEAFFPQQISDFKMASFLNLFGFSGSVEVVYSPKSRCCNVDSSYLDLGVLFLVGTTTRVDILPHKCLLVYRVVWQRRLKQWRTALPPE